MTQAEISARRTARALAARVYAVAIPHPRPELGHAAPLYQRIDHLFHPDPRQAERLTYHPAKDHARIWQARGLRAYARKVGAKP